MNAIFSSRRLGCATALAGLLLTAGIGSAQTVLPDTVKVPAGNKAVLETSGTGLITYECREKQDAAGQFEWVFVGPDAILKDRKGTTVGKYYGPPATWESQDGVKITGSQVAVAPNGSGNIPLQLVKANPAVGQGSWTGVTFIQRLATQGGTAPAMTCNTASKGRKETVSYSADYVFFKAN